VCTVDHSCFAKPGYLIDVPMESIAAPGALFTRLLAHHKEVGLSADQVLQLLDISRDYHERQVALRIAFAQVTEKLEIKWGRVDQTAIDQRQELLDEHARLFRAEEQLFFEFGRRGHDLLTDEQLERAEAIYHAEKNEGLRQLAGSLDNAVAPAFTFRELVEARAPDAETADLTDVAK
jgi:hypothetical protein